MKYKYLVLLAIAASAVIFASSNSKNAPTDRQEINPAPAAFGSPVDSTKSLNALAEEIRGILGAKNLKSSRFSATVYSLDKQRYYFQKNSDALLVPASNTKLLTSFMAINLLGGDYNVATSAYCNESDIDGSVVKGDVYIYGRGDALLNVNDIETIADQIKESGITEIRGRIVADGSFFDEQTERIVYSGDRDLVQATPPITALAMNSNSAAVVVSSGSVSGAPVRVQVLPASSAFRIVNMATVRGGRRKGKASQTAKEEKPTKKDTQKASQKVSKGKKSKAAASKAVGKKTKKSGKAKKSRASLWVETGAECYGGPIKRKPKATPRANPAGGIACTSKMEDDGTQRISISGSLGPNQSVTKYVQFGRPNLVIAGLLKNRLISGGVKVSGEIAEDKMPATQLFRRKLIGESHRRLLNLLYPINKHSDNYSAENLFRLIGGTYNSQHNTALSARDYYQRTLDSLGMGTWGIKAFDGSGLSRRNQISSNAFVRMLTIINRDARFIGLDSTFAIAGRDGTIRSRMLGTYAAGNVRAKTGTHSNVSALSGFVRTRDGELLAFSFVFNGPTCGYYKQIENEICARIAAFSYHRPLATTIDETKKRK